LDLLINNAAIAAPERRTYTDDGSAALVDNARARTRLAELSDRLVR
jgi:hypothetical protein